MEDGKSMRTNDKLQDLVKQVRNGIFKADRKSRLTGHSTTRRS
jgi:hypothetical protein